MRVSKWGNSLAVRLPKAVVGKLGLKPGDRLKTVFATRERLAAARGENRLRAIERMRARALPIPANYAFNRDEANAVSGSVLMHRNPDLGYRNRRKGRDRSSDVYACRRYQHARAKRVRQCVAAEILAGAEYCCGAGRRCARVWLRGYRPRRHLLPFAAKLRYPSGCPWRRLDISEAPSSSTACHRQRTCWQPRTGAPSVKPLSGSALDVTPVTRRAVVTGGGHPA